ncbi:MAG: hydroxyisourate hydrolase [Patulibacter minatonensis]
MSPITVSTHVLDTAAGLPVAGVPVRLARRTDGDDWLELARATTDADGRIAALAPTGGAPLGPGHHRLLFELSGPGDATVRGWYPEVSIVVDLAADAGHVHVPLLLAPYGYTTYRGS